MSKQELTDDARANLDNLIDQLQFAEEAQAHNNDTINDLKQKIIALADTYEFPVQEQKSEEYNRIRVTRPEGMPGLDWKKFVKKHGVDLFIKCFDIKKAELNVRKWNRLLRAEEVTDSMLIECLTDARDLKPRVRLLKETEDEEDWLSED